MRTRVRRSERSERRWGARSASAKHPDLVGPIPLSPPLQTAANGYFTGRYLHTPGLTRDENPGSTERAQRAEMGRAKRECEAPRPGRANPSLSATSNRGQRFCPAWARCSWVEEPGPNKPRRRGEEARPYNRARISSRRPSDVRALRDTPTSRAARFHGDRTSAASLPPAMLRQWRGWRPRRRSARRTSRSMH